MIDWFKEAVEYTERYRSLCYHCRFYAWRGWSPCNDCLFLIGFLLQ